MRWRVKRSEARRAARRGERGGERAIGEEREGDWLRRLTPHDPRNVPFSLVLRERQDTGEVVPLVTELLLGVKADDVHTTLIDLTYDVKQKRIYVVVSGYEEEGRMEV